MGREIGAYVSWRSNQYPENHVLLFSVLRFSSVPRDILPAPAGSNVARALLLRDEELLH